MDCSRTFLSCSLPFRVAGWCSSNEMDKISQSSLLGFAVLYKTYFKKIPRTASYTIYIYPLGIRSRYFTLTKTLTAICMSYQREQMKLFIHLYQS